MQVLNYKRSQLSFLKETMVKLYIDIDKYLFVEVT